MEKRNNRKNNINKKGFTLIELLAVIIILGVLLIIAVPAISRYIESSRKSTYVTSVKSVVNAIATSMNNLEYPVPATNEAIVVPFSEANLEKDTAKNKSPYAPYVDGKSYVIVTFDGQKYNYYVVALDEHGYAIPCVNEKELNESSITTDVNTINYNIHFIDEILATENSGYIDTANLTFRYYSKSGNVLKVKLIQVPYSKGDIVQLYDNSKWYVTLDSKEDTNRVNLVSYYNMSIAPVSYGTQTNSKTGSTLMFDGEDYVNYDSNADIYSISENIINSTKVNLVANGINLAGATVKMPQCADFGCNSTTLNCPDSSYLSYLSQDAFWTSESYGSYVLTINAGIGRATPNKTFGIRVVINNLLKSNIDKTATAALN